MTKGVFDMTIRQLRPTAKVTTQTTTGTVLGFVTWLLVTAYWHKGLPADLSTALPVIIGVVSGFVGGWLKREHIVIPPIPLGRSDQAR